ncbi:MAG: GMC family oxidoreductase N-terminal domain-containing protein [Actinomycetota bacterium]
MVVVIGNRLAQLELLRYNMPMPANAGASSSVHAVLAALARGALGADYTPEVPSRVLASVENLASSSERSQLLAALRALGTRAGALALTGRPIPASWLSATEAEALLQRWVNSRLGVQRRFGSVLATLSARALYAYPGAAWDRLGYPGPLGGPPERSKTLEPIAIASDETLTCDVVVVGSGAGGGCVAARLAQAGADVVVLEKGGYYSESDFHHREGDALRELYLYGSTLTTTDLGVLVIAGSTLGGGTVVNYATSFKTPAHVLKQWREVSGIEAFDSGEFDQHLDAVAERIGVNTDSSAAGRRDEIVEQGLKKLGWHVDMMPRAVRGCTQDEACGYCGFGCRVGAKQSTMRVYLQDAFDAGARLVVGAEVDKVLIDDDRATGVKCRVGAHRLVVNARAVVAACGAIETPALLLRSGLRGQVGHNLHLHPGTGAWGVFDEEVRVWEGTTQARYSNEFRHRDGGWGPMFETVPVHPGSWAMAMTWRSAAHHRSLMDRYRKVGFCAALSRDASAGRVRIGRDGRPRIDYKLSVDDERRIAEGVANSARIIEAAGARKIYSFHKRSPSYVPGLPGAYENWVEATTRMGYGGGAATLASYHQMGSCRMGSDPSTSAINPGNETHEVLNLFVADASAFPTASGVNPMLTVYGIAHRAAGKLLDRLA